MYFYYVEKIQHFAKYVCSFSLHSTFRTKATLSGKQKRQLQEKLEYVQEVVKTKKVQCAFVFSHLKTTTVETDSSNDSLVFLQKNLYEEYLRQSVGDQDMN